jgi:hypothetical protein
MRAGDRPLLIQVKAGTLKPSLWGRFPPIQREELSIMARRSGADAVVCFWEDRAAHPIFVYEDDWIPLSKRGTPDYAVDAESGCWIWLKALQREGYGITGRAGKSLLAHRAYYEDAKGAIPDGLQIDHLCRVRACVNPDHLEAVTPQENIHRTAITKLTPDEVRAIRKDTRPSSQVARDYDITRSWVHRLRKREKRADVADDLITDRLFACVVDESAGLADG